MLLVNVGETEEAVQTFLTQLGIAAPVLLDPDGGVAERYRVNAMPTTYFIASDGTIQDRTIGGPMTEAYLRSRAEALVAEMTP